MPAPQRPGTETSDALDSDLGWTLGVVFRAYIRTVDALFGHLPGGPRGYQVLAAAAQELPGGQGALAQRLGIDKTVMTYLLDDLEQAGLVERRPDPADRRNKRVVATEHGRATWADAQTRLEHAEDHVLAPLEEADRSVFRELLRRLAVQADSLDPVHDTCRLVTELAPDAAPPKPRRSARR
ncbi:MarR family winged helix-turn-helix transcriptional regulator [Streptosporangium amethystogenes subsp. fukuiense]|uniref:MarR family winged helix-turn-helix transcriptional regulator n=1 Tax=Streptosporangium amethystogenes subsp. fukuiense TaxID=698418 RepID=A0ABW2SRE5_9ACTN